MVTELSTTCVLINLSYVFWLFVYSIIRLYNNLRFKTIKQLTFIVHMLYIKLLYSLMITCMEKQNMYLSFLSIQVEVSCYSLCITHKL